MKDVEDGSPDEDVATGQEKRGQGETELDALLIAKVPAEWLPHAHVLAERAAPHRQPTYTKCFHLSGIYLLNSWAGQ